VALVDGNEQAVEQLRKLDVLQVLMACGIATSGVSGEEFMWAMGNIGGVGVVIEAMKQVCNSQEAIQGGLVVLSELAWNPSAEALSQYPQAAPPLLNLARAHAEKAMQAAPGAWPVADESVSFLVETMNPHWEGAVVCAAAESIGRIAVDAPAWRHPLKRSLGTLVAQLRTAIDDETRLHNHLQKYLFWAAAAIAGLPIVLQEMRHQKQSWIVQDAAICSIIDILDGNLEGEYSLSGTEEADAARQGLHVPDAITVVVEAMHLHSCFVALQYRGSHALGLLNGLLPMESEVPALAVDAVIQALRRHPYEFNVVCGVARALRAFLEPRGGRGQSTNAARTLALLREQSIGPSMRQILTGFADTESDGGAELLEDTIFVLVLIDGVSGVAKDLLHTSSTPLLRAAGLKAIFEVGQLFPEILGTLAVVTEVAALIDALAKSVASGDTEVQRNAEMLHGFLCYLSQTMQRKQ